jgi:UV DNA damage endonuclease
MPFGGRPYRFITSLCTSHLPRVSLSQHSTMVPKRKRTQNDNALAPGGSKRVSKATVDPNKNKQILDGLQARRASPDSSDTAGSASKNDVTTNEADEEFVADPESNVDGIASRPPPVNSDYLPLPWKGRLGFACLNTYLRNSNPPVFSSRTCRIASILEHRHPLNDPTQPEHPTKNRPDKEKAADVQLGQKWVESLGLANARDIIKMVRWNDRYGIKFMRLSSEMFPFASHAEYGYKLAPFASEVLEEVGKVIAELGHRVSCHPGQFTQLGSPRKEVVVNSFRDLEYHDEKLTLLKLPEQQNRDAVLILHMGGMFGSKPETLDRFRENYAKLSPSIKQRLVLENDDMCWSVHDLLPICEELNIPLCLDWHHSNIIYDSSKIREGTLDIMEYLPAIKATWTRKGITQKMHYSEPTPQAVTNMQRRKHSPRVATLPPCDPEMDLMIEAKDKEQAVFELMKTFKLPGYETFKEIIPHVRTDENAKPSLRKKKPKSEEDEEEAEVINLMPEDEVGMGGPEGRVYWPPTKEEWLRPKKRESKPKPNNEGAGEVNSETAADNESSTKIKLKATRKKATKPKAEMVETGEPIPQVKMPGRQKKPTKVKAEVAEDDESIIQVQSRGQKKNTRKGTTPILATPGQSDIEVPAMLERRRSKRGGKVNYEEIDTLD